MSKKIWWCIIWKVIKSPYSRKILFCLKKISFQKFFLTKFFFTLFSCVDFYFTSFFLQEILLEMSRIAELTPFVGLNLSALLLTFGNSPRLIWPMPAYSFTKKNSLKTLLCIDELITRHINANTQAECLEIIEKIRTDTFRMGESEILEHLYERLATFSHDWRKKFARKKKFYTGKRIEKFVKKNKLWKNFWNEIFCSK